MPFISVHASSPGVLLACLLPLALAARVSEMLPHSCAATFLTILSLPLSPPIDVTLMFGQCNI